MHSKRVNKSVRTRRDRAYIIVGISEIIQMAILQGEGAKLNKTKDGTTHLVDTANHALAMYDVGCRPRQALSCQNKKFSTQENHCTTLV